MTLEGAIRELDYLEIPFYQKPSLEKIKETIVDTYQQGRADTIEQILEQMLAYRDAHYYSFANYDVEYAEGFSSATNTLISMVEMLKGHDE